MHLSIPFLLLISFQVLLGSASPLDSLILPANISSPGILANLTDFTPNQEARPGGIIYWINDYDVRVGNTAAADAGNGDPAIIERAFAKVAAWAPSQATRGGSYAPRIAYKGAVGGFNFGFTGEGYRFDLDLGQVNDSI